MRALIGLLLCSQTAVAFAAPRPSDLAASRPAVLTPPRPADVSPPERTAPPTLEARPDALDRQAWRFDLRLERPAPLRLTCEQPGNTRERHVLSRPASIQHALVVRGLKADTRYRCRAEALDGSWTTPAVRVATDPLPRDLKPPRISIASSDPAVTGYTLYNYGTMSFPEHYPSNYLVILDAEGNVRWYFQGPGGGGIDASFLGGDRILFTGDAGWERRVQTFHRPTIIGLDKAVQFKAVDDPGSPWELPGSYNHDAGLSEDGKSIFTLAYTEVDHPAGFTWKGFVVKQIDVATNRVVWSWDSDIDGHGALPPVDASDTNPYHANAVDDRWEDGRLYLYVSLKYTHQVLKIDHATGALVWRLGVDGDFTLLETDGRLADDQRWFFSQHDAKVDGDRVTLYDNGLERSLYGSSADYSRALQLELDTETMTARIVGEYTEPGWSEPIWGGFDVLPGGNQLIAMGHYWPFVKEVAESHYSALLETTPAGQVVWRADFGNRYEVTYRAERIPGCAVFANTTYCPTLR